MEADTDPLEPFLHNLNTTISKTLSIGTPGGPTSGTNFVLNGGE
jgi:hypothetical protein